MYRLTSKLIIFRTIHPPAITHSYTGIAGCTAGEGQTVCWLILREKKVTRCHMTEDLNLHAEIKPGMRVFPL